LVDVANIPVPLCSIKEIAEIQGEVEYRLSEVDQLELTLATSLQQAEALRQSILKRAFSGQLVAQDANDEPASDLLARIKAENMLPTEKSKKSLSRSKRNE
jgi:type I restriction enzyme S subunit